MMNFSIIFSILFLTSFVAEAVRPYTGWTSADPFKGDVFVENLGQFDPMAGQAHGVRFAINNGDKIFFTGHSIIYRIERITKRREPEEPNSIEEDELSLKKEVFFV